MIVGLVGFHSAGKSDLSQFLIKKFGWKWVLKQELLREWSGVGDIKEEWYKWYRDLYSKKTGYEVMRALLKRMKYKKNPKNVILLDAIHRPDEWQAVKDVDNDSMLMGLFIPKEVRLKRSTEEDLRLDVRREKYWHTSDQCLLSKIEWPFSGIATSELREVETNVLYNYLLKTGRVS